MTAFSNLTPAEIERTTARLRRVARAWVDDAGADDLAQGAWLRIANGEASGARKLEAFLVGVVKRLARREALSDTRRRNREHQSARSESLPSAAELAERNELAARLAAALGALPDPQRTIMLLHYDEDQSAAQIARHLGLPPGTVRSHLHRARASLRHALGEQERDAGLWSVLLPAWPSKPATVPLTGALLMASLAKYAALTGGCALLAFGAWNGSIGTQALRPELVTTTDKIEIASLTQPKRTDPRRQVKRPGTNNLLADQSPTAVLESRYGTLLSKDDSSPLFGYLMEIELANGGTQAMTTDERGTFPLTGPWAKSGSRIKAIDHPDLLKNPAYMENQSELLTGANHQEIRWHVGPTYRLLATLPASTTAEQFSVELLPSSSTSGSIGIGHAPLRGTDDLWVRFAPGITHMHGAGPWLLSVRSTDGYWAGAVA